MYEILKKDIAYKGLAVLLAILLWLYVINMQNPPTEKTIMVPVTHQNLQDGLVLRSNPGKVEVKVRGPVSIVKLLTEKEIKATIDLNNAQIGENDYLIEVDLPAGVELVLVRPSSMSLAVDALETKQLPVQVITKGTVAKGYSSFEPVLQPSTVVVRGARQMLNKLETALVTINLNQATEDLSLNTPVTLLTKDGSTVTDEYEISPREVQVFVPITKPNNTITVAIKPQIVGRPKEGFEVSGVTIDPETVKISGPYEILSLINHVATAPLDITGIDSEYATQVALVPPDGASLVYQPVVKILVQVQATDVEKEITDIPVAVTNSQEGLKYIIKPEKVALIVRGDREALEHLDKNMEVKAVVDVKELEPGTHDLAVKVELPANMQVLKVEPASVDVTITKEG
ncbi:MAG: YbbR-like domain-containing protein [Peptococcia bacterium]|jgi:YbbR domain-containing protein